MRKATRILILIGVLVLSVLGFLTQVTKVRVAGIEELQYTRNAGEITSQSLVGQTFESPRDTLSGIGILFATYSGRDNTEPLRFELRESIDGPAIREAVIEPHDLGDNREYVIVFEPLEDSRGKIFFWLVDSPTSSAGNAVTIDINTQDPYHLGTAHLVREQADPRDGDVIRRSGKQTVDVAFATYHSVPLRVAMIEGSVEAVQTFIGTWADQKHNYVTWLRALVPAIVLVWAFFWLPQTYTKRTRRLILLTLFIVAVVLRVTYAVQMPATNDEGNYLYDALALRQATLAGGDGYVKAPLMIFWTALWQLLMGTTLLAGRIGSVVIGAATLFPLYWLGREMRNERLGIYVALFWALTGVTTIFNIYVHTQPVAIFLGVSGLAILWSELRRDDTRWKWLLLGGMVLGLGVASRKSVLSYGLIPLALILLESVDWKQRIQRLLTVGVGFLLIITVFLGAASFVYGSEGFWEALGYNSANDGVATIEPHEAEQARAYSIRGITPFFRESLPLILLGVLGLGFAAEQLIRRYMKRLVKKATSSQRLKMYDFFLPKLGWVLALTAFWMGWNFFFEYEGQAFMQWGIPLLWWLFAALIVVAIALPRPRSEALQLVEPEQDEVAPKKSTQPAVGVPTALKTADTRKGPGMYRAPTGVRAGWATVLVPTLWLLGLAFFYFNWIKFHANYIGEFLPPLILLSAFGMMALFERIRRLNELAAGQFLWEVGLKAMLGASVVVVVWAMTVSNYITYVYEHTGTFHLRAVKEAAEFAAVTIPRDESIFTGAAIVPYVSGHRTALDIAHPRWYAYEFTRTDPHRINTFLPSTDEMLQAYREAEWLLLEKQTGFSFLMEYSEIEAGIEADWTAIKGIENGSNTLTFYQRVSNFAEPAVVNEDVNAFEGFEEEEEFEELTDEELLEFEDELGF